jgi:tRNA/rRNA methyltransferase
MIVSGISIASTLAQTLMSGNASPARPIIVLVEPQLGENIGMCARAMLNCGLDRLRLVRPRDGWPNPAAVATAADADEVLAKAEVFASLDEALADCRHVVAATARKRSLAAPVLEAEEAAHQIASWCDGGAETAVLFGAEASGLDNTSIARADRILTFSTNPAFPSLNLAQSVLLFGWEWRRVAGAGTSGMGKEGPVSRGDLTPFLTRLEGALEARGFFLTPDLRPTTEATLRSLFSRATPTERELALLQGVLTALLRRES